MKKIMMLFIAVLVLFGMSSQALSYFEDGHLIRVVYSMTDGSGTEFATDLGDISDLTTPISETISFTENNFGIGTFSGASWGDMYVAYYTLTLTPAAHAWTSGPMDGQTSSSRQWSAYLGAAHSANATYALSGNPTATVLQSDPNSYWKQLNVDTQAGQGMFKNLIPEGNGEISLTDLGTAGYVDQMLYYYGSPNSALAGLQIAQIRTFADGHTELLSASPSSDYTLSLSAAGNGSVTVNGTAHTLPWSGQFQADTPVQVQAVPDDDWSFANWTGDQTGSSNPVTITMSGDRNVTVNFAQVVVDGPDLTVTWEPCTQSCKGSKCKLTGKLTVKNIGNQPAASNVKIYLSDDAAFSAGDSLLREMKTGTLKAGKSKVMKLNYSFASGASATDRYIIAVIDPLNNVPETQENNNSSIYGPIPRANLTGLWTSLEQKCKTGKKGTNCSLQGSFSIRNNGYQDASSSVSFYLSDNGSYEEGDTLLKQLSTGILKPDKTKNIRLNSKLSSGISASDKFVIAVIDADDSLAETNEGDNIIVSDPLP